MITLASKLSLFTKRQVVYFCKMQLVHNVASTQTVIKPCNPTPPHLRRYNLSLMDQFCPSDYIPFIFHYPNNDTAASQHCMDPDKSIRLKTSLSETLAHYYPFAGRLPDTAGSYVDCNDMGIEFQQVTFQCRLSEFIRKPEQEVIHLLYPKQDFICKHDSPLLAVRLNEFQCGGISILVCMSHKLGDAKSFATFMKSWAINSRRLTNHSTSNEYPEMEPPHFISQPSITNEIITRIATATASATSKPAPVPWTTKKFVFPNSEIAKLKATIDHNSCATTRVEAVTSLLFKRAIALSPSGSSGDDFTPVRLIHPANIRSRMIPPVPETLIGNFIWQMNVVIKNSNEINPNTIVEKIQKAKVDIQGMKKYEPLVNISTLLEFRLKNYKGFLCSSICRMQLYQVNFGWGNPCRVTLADSFSKNVFVLMDTPTGDGIEALVTLDEHDMTVFQDDEQIQAYSCP